jgi:hypothetical protein
LRDAVAKGGLRDDGNARLLLGIAVLNQGRPAEARPWFVDAERSPQHREAAVAYLTMIAAQLEPPP